MKYPLIKGIVFYFGALSWVLMISAGINIDYAPFIIWCLFNFFYAFAIGKCYSIRDLYIITGLYYLEHFENKDNE